MTAYVISFNRLTYLQNICGDLVLRGCTPVIVDNSSTYQPLLEWLKDCPYEVHHTGNDGSRSPWKNNIVKGDYYIVTDPDLDISTVPLDMVSMLMRGLNESPTSVKVGLSLRIDDLPDNPYANKAKEYEKRFWETKAGDFYSAAVDTTLALYDAKRLEGKKPAVFYHALRAPEPYTCRHLPWYSTPENLTEEDKYYLNEFKRMFYE